uniref:AlNc14C34G3084 protein n=1 Tax=Albugo laibachii Nc14 TaxID=890382 RepID=F0W8F4_9STRA|nr:AlNc14C34G3084 [Albugo laibachii Nc14]|eukprot:CCA17409.1 AlNc14C34G3084 [Albugo laibachii Nc14]
MHSHSRRRVGELEGHYSPLAKLTLLHCWVGNVLLSQCLLLANGQAYRKECTCSRQIEKLKQDLSCIKSSFIWSNYTTCYTKSPLATTGTISALG